MIKILILSKYVFKELIRKKDFYVFLFLLVGLLVFFYNATFFGVENISRYLKDVGFSLIILFSMIITISLSAKQIPSEIESKTVYPLLAKPISRTHFVLGKFLGSFFISTITFTIFYVFYLLVVFSKGEGTTLILAIQAYMLSVLLLAMLSSITICFSLFFTVPANITMVLMLYFFISWYSGILKNLIVSSTQKIAYFYNVLYYLIPHFEFYDIKTRLVHIWGPLPFWVMAAIFLYTAIYVSFIIWTANIIFRKKTL